MSLRLAVARSAGFSEEAAAKIDDYERSDLPQRAKVALRLADAWLGSPAGISQELLADVRRQFSREQVVDLILQLCKNSRNKMYTAFGMEPAVDPSRVTLIEFDAASGRIMTVGEKKNRAL